MSMPKDKHSKSDIFGKKEQITERQLCNKYIGMSQAHVPPKSCIEEDRKNRIASPYFLGKRVITFKVGYYQAQIDKKLNRDFATLLQPALALWGILNNAWSCD